MLGDVALEGEDSDGGSAGHERPHSSAEGGSGDGEGGRRYRLGTASRPGRRGARVYQPRPA
ncbi:hypothetical protein GCM10009602_24030 [Nocardiopsis tropica]